MYLLCLVYLLLECGDGIGTVGFTTVRSLCHVCRETVKDSQDATDVEDWMAGFVSNT